MLCGKDMKRVKTKDKRETIFLRGFWLLAISCWLLAMAVELFALVQWLKQLLTKTCGLVDLKKPLAETQRYAEELYIAHGS